MCDKKEFTGAEVSLPVLMDEYTKSRETAQIIDNKAIMLLTILVALLTVYMPLVPFDNIINAWDQGIKVTIVLLVIAMLVLLGAIVVAIITFTKLVKTFRVQAYRNVNIQDLVKEEVMRAPSEDVEVALCKHYEKIIIENVSINEEKAKRIKSCFELIIAEFVMLVVSTILLSIV